MDKHYTNTDFPYQRTIQHNSRDIFWIFSGTYAIIDNFAPTPVTVDVGFGEQTYHTSEHAFAAAKTIDPALHDCIAKTSANPSVAKRLGRMCILRDDWDTIKFDVMWRVLKAKFDQHPEAVKVLLSTGDRVIYEGNTWNDRIWGITASQQAKYIYEGRNALGVMLMALRDRYRKTPE